MNKTGNTPKAIDALVSRISEDILFGRLLPRERLVEDEIIARTGATRHAVRAALQALVRDGKIAIYGIHFDFDSADIQPQSADQIEQLASLLQGNAALRVLIVGHTDGEGSFDYNLLLSQRRAQSVVDTLANGHGIERGRLQPAGAGMVSPVASNRTEDGRARNRRVEIVEMIGN